MKSRAVCLACMLSCVASLFTASICVYAEVPVADLPSLEQLPAACREAKAKFRPLTKADLQEARTELLGAVARLDRRLKVDADNGSDWRKYLQWDRMQSELRRDGRPDLAVLDAVYKKYAAGHEGLGLIWFADVRQRLRRYLETAGAIDNPKVKTAYEKLLDRLAEHLRAFAAKPTAEETHAIQEIVAWLQNARQSPVLVQGIRHHFGKPNLLLEASADMAAFDVAGPVDETAPIRDVILGTDIYGTGHTTGETSVELFPDPKRGVIDAVFLGVTKTDSVGYNGPVTIYSKGTTRVGARKRLWIHATGLAALPAVSKAVTETEITDIRANRGRRLVEKIAWKRACQQKSLAEHIASRHAEQRVNDRIDKQAAEKVDRANEVFLGKFRKPLLNRKLFPQKLQFNTTTEAVHVVTLQAGRSQLGAPAAPPELVERPDLAIRVHETMINNLAAGALAGMTLREETFQAAVVGLLGELPDRLKGEEGQASWAISFARRLPISVTFAEETFSITLRGRRYYKGGDSHPGMNVTAVYKIAKTEQGFKAVRQGDVQIFPPGFEPGSGKKIPTRYMVIRTLLERRFGKIFEKELIGREGVLPGRWSKVGKMKPVQLVCQDGWLTVAWKRVSQEKSAAADQR